MPSNTLNDLLALVGRLDDAPGFDTPRERFRRFLFERMADAAALRSLIEEGQYSLGEQHRRAVQDALVMLGRPLGFETSFGSYERVAGALTFDGLWRSRHRVEMTLEVRSSQTPQTPADLDHVTRSLAALPPASRTDTEVRRLALCIVTPLHAGRARLDAARAAEHRQADIRIVSVRSLLWLADAASAGHLRHEEIVRLLTTAEDADFLIGLMERLTAGGPAETESPAEPEVARLSPPAVPAAVFAAAPAEATHWLVTIEADEATTPEQFVASVIRRRHLLGIRNGSPSLRPRAGDWVCFSLRGTGIVGHGQVDSIPEAPAQLRDADRFSTVCALRNVDIYDVPLALGPDARADRAAEHAVAEGGRPSLTSLSSEEFAAFTAHAADDRRAGLRSAS